MTLSLYISLWTSKGIFFPLLIILWAVNSPVNRRDPFWHGITQFCCLKKEKKSRRSGDFLHLFNLVFRAAILDLPVDLPCHSIYTDLVEQPDLQDLVMSMLPEEVMGLQVIRWWPVRHHHLRLTWVNYAAPAKKAPIAAVFNHLFFFVVLYRSPITTVFIISHAISIFNVGGCWSIGCLVCYDDYYTFSDLFTFFYHIPSSKRSMEKLEIPS